MAYDSLQGVDPERRAQVAPYFSNPGGRISAIQLPGEVQGAVLARYSRSRWGVQGTTAREYIGKDGELKLHRGSEVVNRVVNQFGDASIAEQQDAALAVEQISNLATKEVEDLRIGGSPIERSSRYVLLDEKDEGGRWRYHRPAEIREAGLMSRYERACDFSFETYVAGIEPLSGLFRQLLPREQYTISIERNGEWVDVHENDLKSDAERNEFNNSYNFTIRCAALDVGRCALPASTLTNVGITGNGRYFTNLLTRLKSSDISEFHGIAEEMEVELNKVIPTFIKRNKRDPRLGQIRRQMRDITDGLFAGVTPEQGYVTLMPRIEEMDEVLCAALFPYTDLSLRQIGGVVQALPADKKLDILKAYAGSRRTMHDRSGRALEAGYPYTFDLMGTFAEYRDLQRHRMLTQARQLLTTDYGCVIPAEVREVGLESRVLEAVQMMAEVHAEIKRAVSPEIAQYATLFNHRVRFMFGMNRREFQHLSELRTGEKGHFGYRAMTQEMARQVMARDPWMNIFLGFVNFSDPGNKIARAKEQSRIAGKNLKAGISGEIDW
jgi:thymidylate synthase ThyX